MESSHVLVIAPLAVFALFFMAILLFRSIYLMSQKTTSRLPMRHGGLRSMGTISMTDSSVELGCNVSSRAPTPMSQPATSRVANVNPPSYYSDVRPNDSYPIHVPQYTSPMMSLRDPRQFQGLPGLAAPPPYPPPPSYSQIHNFPELPSAPHAVVDASQQPRLSKSPVTPVE
ncbi:unnamed protein product [Caenorhabditis bovis]|uniref:Uncharacterized protein n=1 Tax=Caenorhabditis bovis TaxID=2654633 RepID=A0A8S1EAE6_9PELO|nr:unnamed protein product [Caenorhabditis bovis]